VLESVLNSFRIDCLPRCSCKTHYGWYCDRRTFWQIPGRFLLDIIPPSTAINMSLVHAWMGTLHDKMYRSAAYLNFLSIFFCSLFCYTGKVLVRKKNTWCVCPSYLNIALMILPAIITDMILSHSILIVIYTNNYNLIRE
jgi:hypothetical protein